MASKIQKRRDTAANWASINPVLGIGEPGWEIDTNKEKTGNGVSNWNDLPYFVGGDTSGKANIEGDNLSLESAPTIDNSKEVLFKSATGWFKSSISSIFALLSKGDVGLGNVDNTSDADKPVSTAQQSAIDSNNNDHIESASYDTGTDLLTLTKKDSGTITVLIPIVDAPLVPMGNWNASANTPDISGASTGQFWIVTVAGSQFGISWAVNDWAVKVNSGWAKIDNQSLSTSWTNVTGKPFTTVSANDFVVTGDELQLNATLKSNWNSAYSHSQITDGNPHGITKEGLGVVEPIIATQGVGLLSARPATGLIIDDIYVATDTNLKYTALTATTWNAGVALIEKQFITDLTTDLKNLYQFNGTSIIEPNKTWEKTGGEVSYIGNAKIITSNDDEGIDIETIEDAFVSINLDSNRGTSGFGVGLINGKWDGNLVGRINFKAGSDVINKNNGSFVVSTSQSGTLNERLLIDEDGYVYLLETPTTDTANSPVIVRDATTGELKQLLQLKQTSVASSSSITPTGNYRENEHNITALAANLTINTPSGTAIDNNTLVIRIDDNGTARTLTFNAIYTGDLPTTTVVGSTLYCGFSYNSSKSKWQLIGLKEV